MAHLKGLGFPKADSDNNKLDPLTFNPRLEANGRIVSRYVTINLTRGIYVSFFGGGEFLRTTITSLLFTGHDTLIIIGLIFKASKFHAVDGWMMGSQLKHSSNFT